jgi:hypothetical protein
VSAASQWGVTAGLHEKININTKNKNHHMSYTRTVQFNSRRQSNWGRNQNTVAFASAVKLGPVTHTVLVALMITVLGLIYLTQATRASGYDYAASEITDKISALTDQKKDLEVENARLTALQAVKNSSVAKNMTTPTDVQHVSQ